jgi:hypothetical protein
MYVTSRFGECCCSVPLQVYEQRSQPEDLDETSPGDTSGVLLENPRTFSSSMHCASILHASADLLVRERHPQQRQHGPYHLLQA